ncbi:hypothetical protein AYO38_01165 [bacterium SCGC AG-212-C10]|nr:hypothetical protein AYO38_01165 [bacterium SCGC AG-212-C10]
MSHPLPVRDAVSAGGVVWRRDHAGHVEFVLCGRTAERTWVLPKGTPDAGETLAQTALREVREETGLEVEIGDQLPTIDYWFVAGGYRFHKYVHHWLMTPSGGNTDDHDAEFDEVRWMPAGEAYRALSYENERRVLSRAASTLGQPL